MQERRSGSDAGGGDQTVERLAHRYSLPAAGAAEARGEGEVHRLSLGSRAASWEACLCRPAPWPHTRVWLALAG